MLVIPAYRVLLGKLVGGLERTYMPICRQACSSFGVRWYQGSAPHAPKLWGSRTNQCLTGVVQCWTSPHMYRVLLGKLVGGL